MIQIIAAILSMAGSWMVYKKMGRQGWEGVQSGRRLWHRPSAAAVRVLADSGIRQHAV